MIYAKSALIKSRHKGSNSDIGITPQRRKYSFFSISGVIDGSIRFVTRHSSVPSSSVT